MKISIKNVKQSQTPIQAGVRSNDLLKDAIPLYAMWGVVLLATSEHDSIDVELSNGVELRGIEVRSLEWAGANSIGFGERDLPPKDSYVLIIFPDGNIESGFALCSTLNRSEPKHISELLVSGKEKEYLKIREGGLKETYNKETGEYTLVINEAIINVDADGAVIVTPKSGEVIELAGNTKNLVTHAELNTALQNFLTALKAAVVSGCQVGSGGTIASVTLNISTAEATKLKTS